jgi:hypothetical protein
MIGVKVMYVWLATDDSAPHMKAPHSLGGEEAAGRREGARAFGVAERFSEDPLLGRCPLPFPPPAAPAPPTRPHLMLPAIMRSSRTVPAQSLPSGPGAWSRANSAVSASFSAGVRKRAPAMEAGRNANTQMPRTTEGRPSIMNSHWGEKGGAGGGEAGLANQRAGLPFVCSCWPRWPAAAACSKPLSRRPRAPARPPASP